MTFVSYATFFDGFFINIGIDIQIVFSEAKVRMVFFISGNALETQNSLMNRGMRFVSIIFQKGSRSMPTIPSKWAIAVFSVFSGLPQFGCGRAKLLECNPRVAVVFVLPERGIILRKRFCCNPSPPAFFMIFRKHIFYFPIPNDPGPRRFSLFSAPQVPRKHDFRSRLML